MEVNLYSVSSKELIMQSVNIFEGALWPIRFHSKFVSKLSSFMPNEIEYVLSFVYLLADGQFYGKKFFQTCKHLGEYGYVVPLDYNTLPKNRFFNMKIFREKNMLFSVGVEKKPIFKSGVIKRYEYNNYIMILDIVSDQLVENPKKLDEAINRFIDNLKEDVAKKDHGDEVILEDKKNENNKGSYLFEEVINSYLNQAELYPTVFDPKIKHHFYPIVFKTVYVSANENESLIFDKEMKRWVNKDYHDQAERRALNLYQRKVNE